MAVGGAYQRSDFPPASAAGSFVIRRRPACPAFALQWAEQPQKDSLHAGTCLLQVPRGKTRPRV